MDSNFIQHQISALRHQMKALDMTLALIYESLATQPESPQNGHAHVKQEQGVICPGCQTVLTPDDQFTAMGHTGVQYACQTCGFQGPLPVYPQA